MEKRRVRLEINGVVIGLITEESDEYVQQLARQVGEQMRAIQAASPYITREAAALTAALGYLDDAKKAEDLALRHMVAEDERPAAPAPVPAPHRKNPFRLEMPEQTGLVDFFEKG